MNRDALEHLLRSAAAITHESTFYVVGTAAVIPILPDDHALPIFLVRSREADLIPASASDRSIDLIDGALGMDSTFDNTFGYYADGVDFSTVRYAPRGWRERTLRFSTPATNGAVGLCMEPHDLAISKICAGREKDLEFVQALAKIGLVTKSILLARLAEISAEEPILELARQRIGALSASH